MHHAAASAAPPSLLRRAARPRALAAAPAHHRQAAFPDGAQRARVLARGVKVAPREEPGGGRPEANRSLARRRVLRRARGGASARRVRPHAAGARRRGGTARGCRARPASASAEAAPRAGVTCANCRTQKTPPCATGSGPRRSATRAASGSSWGSPAAAGWPPGHARLAHRHRRKRAAHGDAMAARRAERHRVVANVDPAGAIAHTGRARGGHPLEKPAANRAWRRATRKCGIARRRRVRVD